MKLSRPRFNRGQVEWILFWSAAVYLILSFGDWYLFGSTRAHDVHEACIQIGWLGFLGLLCFCKEY